MLKKFTTLFIAFALLSSQVMAAEDNGLKTAFDELQYALTVDWDQEDKAFYQEQVDKFQAKLAEMKASNEEILSTLKNEFKDENLAREIDHINSTLLNSQMNQEETQSFVLERLGSTYSQGAQWSSDVAFTIVGVLILAVLVAAVLSKPLPKHSNGWFACRNEDGTIGTVYGPTSEWSGYKACP